MNKVSAYESKQPDANGIISWTEEEKQALLGWATTFKMSIKDLEFALSQKHWRKSMIK